MTTRTMKRPTTQPTAPRFLTVPEAAVELRSHEGTVRKLAREGRLPAVKIGGKILILRAELEKMLTPATRG